jgi:7-cyano-7-deazaguanine reductase
MSQFSALGHAGSDTYVGLETFDNPGLRSLILHSDEFTAVCPMTGQPDLYEVEIAIEEPAACIESKSLKIYLSKFRNEGAFCEALAVQIKTAIFEAISMHDPGVIFHEAQVAVTLLQKRRGGIEIEATA